jgi:hypothetical protein
MLHTRLLRAGKKNWDCHLTTYFEKGSLGVYDARGRCQYRRWRRLDEGTPGGYGVTATTLI